MMVYIEYGFYTTQYKGNVIPGSDFSRLATRASGYIDYITIGRAASYSADDAVKMAACAVADIMASLEKGGELSSQSVGGWTQNYVTTNKSNDRKLYDAAMIYLSNTGLLSRWC